MNAPLRTAIIGCGLMGARRAGPIVAHPDSQLVRVVDTDASRAHALGNAHGVPAGTDPSEVIGDREVDALVLATPPAHFAEMAARALAAGQHVLMEKPMGCNVADAEAIARAGANGPGVLKVGFNHRYHPAIRRAHALLLDGAIGKVINIRGRYGHGGRPGYAQEWRGDPARAGGGAFTDQGVHLLDLARWFAGDVDQLFAYTQQAVWPVAPLEDSAFALLRFRSGAVASLHSSWTQWRNIFSLEITGDAGAVSIDGLVRHYGPQRLTVVRRRPEGGLPEIDVTDYPDEDLSWDAEWADFLGAVQGRPALGSGADGLAAMRLVAAAYESAAAGLPVRIGDA